MAKVKGAEMLVPVENVVNGQYFLFENDVYSRHRMIIDGQDGANAVDGSNRFYTRQFAIDGQWKVQVLRHCEIIIKTNDKAVGIR